MAIRDIDNDDREFIDAQIDNGIAILRHYQIEEPTNISPGKICQGLAAWRQDCMTNRPEELEIIRALGCLLGHCAVSKGLGKWKVVEDSFGVTLGVQRISSDWIFHPLDVVSKRTKTEPVEEVGSAYDVFVIGPPPIKT